MAGKREGSPTTVMALIESLPEDATFVSYMSAQRKLNADEDGESDEEVEISPERKALVEEHTWASHDRKMMAQLLNLVVTLIKVTGNWDEKNVPEFPQFGPEDWFKDSPEENKPKVPRETLALFGM